MDKQRLSISRRLNSFTYWLYDKKGLGLQQIVEKILDPLKTTISQEEVDKYINGVNILKNNGNISDTKYQNFIQGITTKKLIYTNSKGELDEKGSWDYVNKLNTNYSDLSDLLTELLIRSYNSGNVVSNKIIHSLLSNSTDNETKNVLLKHKHKFPQLFDTYLESPSELLKFTNNIKINSSYGETLEDNVIKKLESMGGELLYQGGNGDFIDMLFSVDFIIKTKSGISAVQVKSNENQVRKLMSDINRGSHSAVDIIIYPTNNKYKIFMVKDKVTKEIDK